VIKLIEFMTLLNVLLVGAPAGFLSEMIIRLFKLVLKPEEKKALTIAVSLATSFVIGFTGAMITGQDWKVAVVAGLTSLATSQYWYHEKKKSQIYTGH
jgi:hypothetical protein